MENSEKIKKLEREISKLRKKKDEKDKVSKLLAERNKLKFPRILKTGKFLKETGRGIANWADEKNKQIEEDMMREEQEETIGFHPNHRKKKKKHKKSRNFHYQPEIIDPYDALFGDNTIARQMGF